MSSPASLLHKKQKMSLSQTYYLAHTARGKLSKEAARADHDLRLLVGHANLLDGLMVDLAEAEREQESWFNETVRRATKEPARHISWADALPATPEDEEAVEDSDSESDDAEFEYEPTPAIVVSAPATDMDLDDEDEYDDEDDESLQLTRTPSRSSPPELVLHESDSESEDEMMPPSPPAVQLQQQPPKTKKDSSLSPDAQFYEDGFYLPQRQAIAAF